MYSPFIFLYLPLHTYIYIRWFLYLLSCGHLSLYVLDTDRTFKTSPLNFTGWVSFYGKSRELRRLWKTKQENSIGHADGDGWEGVQYNIV
jgi:hypothetical protein